MDEFFMKWPLGFRVFFWLASSYFFVQIIVLIYMLIYSETSMNECIWLQEQNWVRD